MHLMARGGVYLVVRSPASCPFWCWLESNFLVQRNGLRGPHLRPVEAPVSCPGWKCGCSWHSKYPALSGCLPLGLVLGLNISRFSWKQALQRVLLPGTAPSSLCHHLGLMPQYPTFTPGGSIQMNPSGITSSTCFPNPSSCLDQRQLQFLSCWARRQGQPQGR